VEAVAEGMFGRVLLAFTYAGSPFSSASQGEWAGHQPKLTLTKDASESQTSIKTRGDFLRS
jgi:hypothetical protein